MQNRRFRFLLTSMSSLWCVKYLSVLILVAVTGLGLVWGGGGSVSGIVSVFARKHSQSYDTGLNFIGIDYLTVRQPVTMLPVLIRKNIVIDDAPESINILLRIDGLLQMFGKRLLGYRVADDAMSARRYQNSRFLFLYSIFTKLQNIAEFWTGGISHVGVNCWGSTTIRKINVHSDESFRGDIQDRALDAYPRPFVQSRTCLAEFDSSLCNPVRGNHLLILPVNQNSIDRDSSESQSGHKKSSSPISSLVACILCLLVNLYAFGQIYRSNYFWSWALLIIAALIGLAYSFSLFLQSTGQVGESLPQFFL